MNDRDFTTQASDERGGRRGRGFGRRHGFGPRFGAEYAAAGFGPEGPGGFGPGAPFGPRGPFGPGGPLTPGGRRRGQRGQVRTAVLALLAEGPSNGYQIMQTLAERTQGAWRPSPGTVYPTLSQLEDEGLITATAIDGQKAFELTDTGREAAAKIERTPWDVVNDAVSGAEHDELRELWGEFAALGGALKELARSGEPQDWRAATELLGGARRRLYGLLAEENSGPAASAPDAEPDPAPAE